MATDGFTQLQSHNNHFRLWCMDVETEASALRQEFTRDLDRPLEDSPAWCAPDETDLGALAHLSELESGFDNFLMMIPSDVMDTLDPPQADQANVKIDEFLALRDRFHTALPFGEAERGWFLKAYSGDFEPTGTGGNVLKAIGNQEARIVTAGVRQVVNGRELVRRWLAWRRETDEYADQGTLDLARVTLDEIVTLTSVKSRS